MVWIIQNFVGLVWSQTEWLDFSENLLPGRSEFEGMEQNALIACFNKVVTVNFGALFWNVNFKAQINWNQLNQLII